ncbi:MAG: flagellar basal-body MS-ring/collar protein FliF [Armatimonadota bacterium]|nr:flagellar basal-body MS-ring/collar protein FliF [Armatimonadota bacterium]
MNQLSKLGPFAALSKLWGELSPPQRLVVAAFSAVSLASLVLIGVVASKPRMSVLFSGLTSEDAGAIVQKLTEQKIPYRLSADGSTIEVPANKVYDVRLQLATQGLPQGGTVGFELFDKSNFGMTEFAERLNYQRAIQGELQRTIKQLAPVIDARVHVALPEEKLYASEQEPVTASVVLRLRRGTPLTDEQVGGIVHLVASAVEGLKPSNVTVVDTDGNVLSEPLAGGSSGGQLLTAAQTKMKRQYESELAANLQSMLARIVGPDKVVVRVSAELSFDQKETKSEIYEPARSDTGGPTGTGASAAEGVLVSQETRTETYSGSVQPPPNLPARSGARPAGTGDNYTRKETTAQYQVTKRIEQTISAPGQVRRLSVAVLVDDKVEPAKVPAIEQAVAAAAGIDTARGDQITVQRVRFDTSLDKARQKEMASASRAELISALAKNVGAILLLAAFLVVLRSIVKQIRIQVPEATSLDLARLDRAPQETRTEASPVRQEAAQVAQQLSESGVSPTGFDGLPPEIAQSKPEDLARLVRSWMSEQ